VQAKLEPYAREAIELFYELGQLIADPSLAASAPSPPPAVAAPPDPAGPKPARKAVAPKPAALPAGRHWEHGFDIWCLTDPEARKQLEHVPQALHALLRMWRLDPDPARTRAIHAEIQSAFDRGEIAYGSNGSERLGYFHCCPWGAIYVANRPVTLGGRRLTPMQRFVYNVGAPDPADGFRRGILFGNFQETGDLEYGPHRPAK
jgi:hypothetical protein